MTLSLRTIIKELHFLGKTIIVHWNTWKKKEKRNLLLLANKLIEKIPDPCKAKEHYQLFIRKKNTKSVKQSEIFTSQTKSFENPNIVDIKSVITEHPKASHKWSKSEKVGSNSSLYSNTKKYQNENMLLKTMQVLIMLKFEILLTLYYNLKILNL